jgi:hypothetical protein
LKRFSFCRQNSKITGPVGKVGLRASGGTSRRPPILFQTALEERKSKYDYIGRDKIRDMARGALKRLAEK